MKALLLKDTCVIWKQMKYFLFLIVIFSAIPSAFNNIFAIVYAAMLPYTAMAYDERSKWDQLAAMMPYSARDLVLSKYVFGWLCIAGATVISVPIQCAVSLFGVNGGFSLTTVLLSVCCGLGIMSITLPLMFRFGVEKGRLTMFLIIFLVCGGAGAISTIAVSAPEGYSSMAFRQVVLPAAVAAAAVLTAVSVPLSVKFYSRRES